MTSNYPETDNYGFVRFGEGESIAKEGFAVSDKNVVSMDRILKALASHTHTGGPRLANPVAAPDVTQSATGGTLPAGQTYYYLISYEDQYGLETAASPEVAITTPPALGVPTAPALSVETTGGTLVAGTYRYALASRTAGGGLTTTSATASAQVLTGSTNRILIVLPELPVGAEALVIFRSRPGQSQYYYWSESATGADLYDDGSVAEDPTVLAPAFNSSGGTNAVTVSVPGGVLPDGAARWRVYRTSQPGFYNSLNLVHLVSEGVTEGDPIPRTDWVDDGSPLLRGQPRRTSATFTPPPAITVEVDTAIALIEGYAGLRSWSVFVPGTVALGTVYAKLDMRKEFRADRLAAYFTSAPTTSPTGTQVGFELVSDNASQTFRPAVGTDGTGPFASVKLPTVRDAAGVAVSYYKTFEAETGDRQGGAAIVTDLDNYNLPDGKAVELATDTQWVDLNLGVIDLGDYGATAYIYTPGATETNGLRISIYRATAFESGTPANVLVTQTFTARLAAPTGAPGRYVVPFRVTSADLPDDSYRIFMRVEKIASSSTALYHVDYIRLAAENQPVPLGPVALRATLLDQPDAAILPPYSVGPARVAIKGFDREEPIIRVYVREGLETTVAIPIASSNGASMTWTAASDQAWCTLSSAGATGISATVTATVVFASLTAGTRNLATVTFTASGYETFAVQVVALRTPTALGGDVNITIDY